MRLQNRLIITALVLGACASVSFGCGSSEPEGPKEGWTTFQSRTFEGESIALDLPDFFVGGDLFDSEMITELERKISQCPDPERTERLRDALTEEMRKRQTATPTLLWMLGPFDAEGRCAEVLVSRAGSADDYASLEDFLEQEEGVYENLESSFYIVESFDDKRARAELVIELSDETLSLQMLYFLTTRYVYRIHYWSGNELDNSLDSVFASSAETITIKTQ